MSELKAKWRRRVMPVAFLAALALLATRTCRSEMAAAEVHFEVGPSGAELRSLSVELRRDGEEVLGTWRRTYEEGALDRAGTWPLSADSGHYKLHITAELSSGVRQFERGIQLLDQATITVNLEPDLRD